jgi:acyl carrier protein
MQGESMRFTVDEMKLAKFFIERDGEGILEVIRNIDFLDEGIIDSLDFVSLAVFIEQNFGKKLDLTDPTTFQAMRRFGSLVAMAAH